MTGHDSTVFEIVHDSALHLQYLGLHNFLNLFFYNQVLGEYTIVLLVEGERRVTQYV
ncbi:hypothetical protein BH23CYA1_BH23CYA1_13910 [soil metagenome]